MNRLSQVRSLINMVLGNGNPAPDAIVLTEGGKLCVIVLCDDDIGFVSRYRADHTGGEASFTNSGHECILQMGKLPPIITITADNRQHDVVRVSVQPSEYFQTSRDVVLHFPEGYDVSFISLDEQYAETRARGVYIDKDTASAIASQQQLADEIDCVFTELLRHALNAYRDPLSELESVFFGGDTDPLSALFPSDLFGRTPSFARGPINSAGMPEFIWHVSLGRLVPRNDRRNRTPHDHSNHNSGTRGRSNPHATPGTQPAAAGGESNETPPESERPSTTESTQSAEQTGESPSESERREPAMNGDGAE